MITAAKRPLSFALDRVASLVLYYAPARPEDHLFHAWKSLETAACEPSKRAANVAFAITRADCAEALLYTLKGRKLAAARTELATLRDEIRSA